jgi:beta-glucanase (GH16 family)
MNRRNMMLMTGAGLLAAAALPVPEALAYPSRPDLPASPVPAPTAPPDVATGPYIFQDEFDGPAGSAPDPAKWIVWNWDVDVTPPIEGHYRNDRRNVFLDGNSNLVIRATQEFDQFYSGKLQANWRGVIGHTWEARIKFDCLTPGCWPAYWLVNEDPLPDGEIDVVEWYGNGKWASGSTVHARSDGKTWEGNNFVVDSAWHTWRVRWDESGFRFWRDYVDGAEPYLTVPAAPINGVWPFNQPGYWMFPVLNLAVGGPGGGDPNLGTYPADMLVDWIRIW